ncbi:MAG: hypothetical protein ABSH06_23645 [Thermodesulfobacteriota bacterium]|jgi:hypothetical protein
MRKIIFVISVLLVLSFVHLAYAQFGKGAGPKFHSDFKPVVGGWSEYQMTGKGESLSKMKIAIVGKEGDAYWYETIMETKQEGRIISKMLVSGNPEDQKNMRRMIVKMGNEPAMEMPIQMMQASKDQGQKGKIIDKGKESIKVPAGTFTAQHMQYQDGEIVVDTWVHKDVSPYGMVKSQSKEFEMVLLGYGTGAKTLITETPQKFEMPQMPQKRK